MSRDSYRNSIFTLPNRIVRDSDMQWRIPFNQVLNLTESQPNTSPRPGYIFHPAHCGSTLLSRALDIGGQSLVIRESYALRQFSASPPAQTSAEQQARQRGLNCIIDLLSRRYSENERVVLKANVPVNYVIDELSAVSRQNSSNNGLQGIILFSQLDNFLLAILKSEQRRVWAKHVAKELQARIVRLPNLTGVDYNELDFNELEEAQAAAILWASQMQQFESALKSNPGLRALKSDSLFRHPKDSLVVASKALGMQVSEAEIGDIVRGELLKKHAKTPERDFSEATRQAEQLQLMETYQQEIDSVKAWMTDRGIPVETSIRAD